MKYATLEVSRKTYNEIAKKLTELGQDSRFMVGRNSTHIDLNGVLIRQEPPPGRRLKRKA